MTPSPPVLIGLPADDMRERLAGLVRDLGYEPAVPADGRQTVAWARERPFAASLLDAGLEAGGGRVWRMVRPILGRRLVLVAWQPGNDLWFEALRVGVTAVLPLPPVEAAVRAALEAVAARSPWGMRGVRTARGDWHGEGDVEDQAAE